jgi:chitinase
MPANKITLGVPAYGYLQKSTATQLKDRRRTLHGHLLPHKQQHLHSRAGHVTVYNDNGGSSDGQVMFESLISQGALAWNGDSGSWVGAGGFTREWDSCSSTVSSAGERNSDGRSHG